MQDMIPPRRPSIRSIPVAPGHRHLPSEQGGASSHHRSRRQFWLLGAGVLVTGAVVGLVLSTLFERATITVYLKTQDIALPPTILAAPNAPEGMLSYQTVTITETASTSAQTTGTQQVSKYATGAITIYNSYSTASQKLTANTRFQASDGKIYRIHTALTVPGESAGSYGTYTPGSVTTIIYADAPGVGYNRATTTSFTIPGFKSDPRYSKFTAQSQGAIIGGFVGSVPAVTSTDEKTAEGVLKQQLQASLQSAAQKATPSGFIAAQGQGGITYADIVETPASATNVTLSQSASELVVLVRASDLATLLATQAIPIYKNEPIAFADPSKVALTLPTDGTTTGQLTLGMSGTTTLVWQFDPNAVKKAVAGKQRSTFEQSIDTFQPAIAKATAAISPFWKQTFPTDPAKITVQVAQ